MIWLHEFDARIVLKRAQSSFRNASRKSIERVRVRVPAIQSVRCRNGVGAGSLFEHNDVFARKCEGELRLG